MEVDSYLNRLVGQLTIDKSTRDAINASFDVLKAKIWSEYQDRLRSVELFGSYLRATELPQKVDIKSDVDILVVFKSNDFKPTTMLNHLLEFADTEYSRSDVLKSHPTVVIEMKKVRFEIVPAYYESSFWNGEELKIPAPRNNDLKWITTEPQKLHKDLVAKNLQAHNLVIPVIKLIKYFNVRKGRPYESYLIEQHAIGIDYEGQSIREFLMQFIDELDTSDANDLQREFISELRVFRKNLYDLLKLKMYDYAKMEVEKYFPLLS